MRNRAALAALALVLAGCEDGAPEPRTKSIRIANPHHDQLMGLSPDMQNLGLMRAIRDNGKRCKKVEAAGYQEEYRGMAMWVASCDDGRSWAVFISPSGDVQVRDCAEAARLGLPQCRVPDPAAAAAPGPTGG